MAVAAPQHPKGIPPPNVLPDPDHPLFIAYLVVHQREEKKPEHEKLGGEAYVHEVMKYFQHLKYHEADGKMSVVDGEVFVEVEVEGEERVEDEEVDSELFCEDETDFEMVEEEA